jgi:hypothetical protein
MALMALMKLFSLATAVFALGQTKDMLTLPVLPPLELLRIFAQDMARAEARRIAQSGNARPWSVGFLCMIFGMANILLLT